MDLFIQIVMFIVIISVLVILHELGHFIPAKLFKTKVEKFYLFFDVKFSLFKKKIGETVYGIGWLPLGGYVKIAGMIDESMDTDQMKEEPQPWEFRSKPAWQRLIIMLGGVTVNFLLAWVIYTFMFMNNGETYIPVNQIEHGLHVDPVSEKIGLKTGDKILEIDGKKVEKLDRYLSMDILFGDEIKVLRDGNEVLVPLSDEGKKAALESRGRQFIVPRFPSLVIGHVEDDSNAESAGIQVGDKFERINDQQLQFWDQVTTQIRSNRGETLSVDILRDGRKMNLRVQVPDSLPVGIRPDSNIAEEVISITKEYSFASAIPRGFIETINVLVRQVKQFKLIFNPIIQGYKQVKGPIGIVEMMPTMWDWGFFWSFMAMFSVWLAFINVLPIPALDGGHVMFLLYEMISGRPPSQKVLERGQIVGFVILMGLMVVIFGNDIWNIIKRFI
ncbi:RIP metalloprotease RseP [Muricauda sp. 2012CJ35-5]|uniref:Zinc metalloprotease n=1 Tax=Flagellimonas spongiicola TaxID=2942208 RepID=A0ABT0PSY5_9FLAO|nr:RIP metalloprotease RseP [Allomuricauda spongiicola]MCL6274502.1 RIP metalloprotease RseP [Allomuricauda spongiicola]